MANTILTKLADGGAVRKEGVASAAITPGMLVEFGGAADLRAHAAAGGAARKAFAVENDLVGGGINDAYDAGDTVQYLICQPGEELQAFLADGQNVVRGAALVSAGGGALAAASTAPEDATIVAFALEPLNNSSGAPARIRVEVA